MASRITIFSLVKAFRVLELVSSSTSGYTLTELVRHLKISMGYPSEEPVLELLSDKV